MSRASPGQQVRDAVAEFGRATAAKDYRTLCDRLLAPSLIEEVESIGLPCRLALRQGLRQVRDPRLTMVGRIEVRDDRASAQVRTTATREQPSEGLLELVSVDGSWKISSLGT